MKTASQKLDVSKREAVSLSAVLLTCSVWGSPICFLGVAILVFVRVEAGFVHVLANRMKLLCRGVAICDSNPLAKVSSSSTLCARYFCRRAHP